MFRRGLIHDDPPALQTQDDMRPTLLISWWCTGFALLVIVVRVFGRYIRTEKLFREDKIMAASIIPLFIRMAFVHVILLWGTNNTTTDGLSALDIRHREIGSRLVLASRIFYAAFIWVAKLTVLEFLKRIVGTYWRRSYELGIQIIRYFLLATFVAVTIATLAECQPFEHYWQVIPDPGPQCRGGVAQLLTMAVCDIITDILLVIYPIPIVIMAAMPLARKISLVALFALSLALVAITSYRVPSTISRGNAQQYRSLLASLEILAATGVSNSIVIGSFIRDRGTKKAKYRRGSTGGTSSLERSVTRHTTITQNVWGSDVDLASDVGMCLAPDLQSRRSSVPSITPRSAHPPSDHSSAEKGEIDKRSVENEISSISTNSTYLKHETSNVEKPNPATSPPLTPKKMSFFEVESLMQNDEKMPSPPRSRAPTNSSDETSFQDMMVTMRSVPQQHRKSRNHSTTPLANIGDPLSNTRPITDPDLSIALSPAPHHLSSSNLHHQQPLAPSSPPSSDHQHLPTSPPPPSSDANPSALSSPPSTLRNFSRPASISHHPSTRTHARQNPTDSSRTVPPPPPPSYQPRRDSEASQWDAAEAANSLDIVDAGGLLK